MNAFFENEIGKIEIANECIAKIVGISSMECYGVVGMATKNITDGIVSLLGFENLQKGIKVVPHDGIVDIDVHIIVEYGTRIPVIAHNIKEKIMYAVSKYTGLKPGKMNIYIDGIRID